MKVSELIYILESYDDDCEVILMTQENYPFENDIAGVTDRISCDYDDDGNPTDVFIVEGEQIRYGDKSAWDNI